MTFPDLTPRQHSALMNCLRVAADRFAEDAKTIRADYPTAIGWQRIADQFDRQRAEALLLFDTIQEAEYAEAEAT